ncbi:MAG: hypothetical protein P8126_05175 [Gammaproteobacteria bacterium]
MIKKATFTSFWVLLLSLMGANAFAQTYVVNAVVREFRPDILYIKPGDTGVIVVGKPVGIDADMKYARAHLQGPKRRLIGKLLKVQRAAKQAKK